MEIPNDIKNLYRHWNFHTEKSPTQKPVSIQGRAPLEDICWFIKERIKIWERKTNGKKPPYTQDAILCRYRFCNIFREFDRQTIEFHTLLSGHRDNFPLWLLNMFYCRMVARTETIKAVGLLSFDEKENRELCKRFVDSPRPRFGTPYVFPISAIQKSDTPTRELFITKYLPSIIEVVAEEINRWDKKSAYDGLKSVIPLFKYNLNFLWTEVLIDVAYQFPQHIDLFGRFPIGPGSLPTMQRIDAEKDPTLLVRDLSFLKINTGLTFNGRPLRLSAENWEGIGCEYRKYTNLKLGKGRKRLFHS